MEEALKHAEDLVRLGIELQEQGRLDDALQAYERALFIYPEHPTALLRRGHVRLQKKEYRSALEDIERVMAYDAGDQRAWAYRGLIHQGLGDDDKAIADFTQALTIREAGTIHYCRGFSYRRMGHEVEAAADFKRAHELALLAPEDGSDKKK